MLKTVFPASFKGFSVHFVGIKGTGMAALAELFHKKGAMVTGSDTQEKFYTDLILQKLGIPFAEGFSENNLKKNVKLVVFSAAYSIDTNPELVKACKINIPVVEYSQALGYLSNLSDASGIAGVNGKTTTTAIAGSLIKQLDLPCSVLTGSSVMNFNDCCTLVKGEKYFIAETCEYKRNFLHFCPDRLIFTGIEPDHLDYFKDYEDILSAFTEYAKKLPLNGELIFCADDKGAKEASNKIILTRPDIKLIPYGEKADGDYRITSCEANAGRTVFRLKGFDKTFFIRVPGKHNVLNTAAAVALVCLLLRKENNNVSDKDIEAIARGIEEFSGSRRRSEVLGEAGGILFMDDYGHHPTAIKTTLKGIKDFYPDRRLIVDFMSHTYSRTEALLEDFSKAFGDADKLILHKIYSSAREKKGRVTGKDLYNKTCFYHPDVHFIPEVIDALYFCLNILKPGDLFLTMGAGDNWRLGNELYKRMKKREGNL